MSDRRLDPVTGDFVSAPGGAFESCLDIENQVAFSFLVRRGSWEGDPDMGHRFEELARVTDVPTNRNRLRDLAKDALKWLVDLGKIERVEVAVESLSPGSVAFQVDYFTPNAKSPKKAGPFLVPVGAT